jgi:hypothetical protein
MAFAHLLLQWSYRIIRHWFDGLLPLPNTDTAVIGENVAKPSKTFAMKGLILRKRATARRLLEFKDSSLLCPLFLLNSNGASKCLQPL